MSSSQKNTSDAVQNESGETGGGDDKITASAAGTSSSSSSSWRTVDLDTWPRRHTFAFYQNAARPQWGSTVRLNVTTLRQYCKQHNVKYFFASFYILNVTCNEYEPIRYRIRTTDTTATTSAAKMVVVVHDTVRLGTTVLRKDGETFGFCALDNYGTFSEYVKAAQIRLDQFHANESGMGDVEGDHCLHGTVLPWIDFTSMEHAESPPGMESIPKFTYGKVVLESNGSSPTKWVQSFCLHVHHGLMDGLHVGRFLEKLQQNLDQADVLLST